MTLPSDKELFTRVEEVTHYLWDPIGISSIPGARDEYSRYLAGMYGRVKAGKLEEIVAYMQWVATEQMGLQFDRPKAELAAKAMLEWKQEAEKQT